MAKVVIKWQGQSLKQFQANYERLLKQFIPELTSDLLLEIVKLTNKGMNAYNEPFQSYSAGYIKQRKKKGLGITPNMQYSSDMMNSLTPSRLSSTSWKLGFLGSDRDGVSNVYKAAKLERTKNYIILGFTDYYLKFVDKKLKRFMDKVGKEWSK